MWTVPHLRVLSQVTLGYVKLIVQDNENKGVQVPSTGNSSGCSSTNSHDIRAVTSTDLYSQVHSLSLVISK